MSNVLSRTWVDQSESLIKRRDGFFALVAEQQTAMLVLCGEHLCDLREGCKRP